MDLNKTGPSRRHIPTSSSQSSTSTPMYSESYFQVDSFDDFNDKPSSFQPPRPPSSTFMSNSQSNQQQQQQNSQFDNFNNNQSPFFTTPPNQNDFGGGGVPPRSSMQQQQQQPWQQGPPSMMQSPLTNQFVSAATTPIINNPQLLMGIGQELFTNPMTAAAINTYSQTFVDKGKGWLDNIKQYFAVDTNYAVKKLFLIFLPFLHKDWSIRYNTESVAPRDEPNLPDLYIPSMAFITYILLSGYILGLRNQFAPEQLGIYATSAFGWLLLEVLLIMIAKYLLNLSSLLGFFHMIAFGGYKFVYIDALLLISVLFGNFGSTIFFIYASLSLGYFLLRALSTNLQQGQQSSYQQYDHNNPRMAYYLVIFIALLQPLVIYFLTSSLIYTSAATIPTPSNSIPPVEG